MIEQNGKLYITWDDIHHYVESLNDHLIKNNQRFHYIIGLARGGLIPAVMASHATSTQLMPVSYSSANGKGEYKQYDNNIPDIPLIEGQPASILLMDDLVDSGNTMSEVYNILHKRGHSVMTTTVLYKKSSSIKTDFSTITVPADAPWIVFPYEM